VTELPINRNRLDPARVQDARRILRTACFSLTTLLGALLAGCTPANEGSLPPDSPPAAAPDSPAATSPLDEPSRLGIRFDPDTVAPGSVVGELALDSVWRRDPAGGRDADSGIHYGASDEVNTARLARVASAGGH
jgi:hypothetical protein